MQVTSGPPPLTIAKRIIHEAMFTETIQRLLIALILIGAGVGLYWLFNRALLARLRGRRLGLEAIQPGVPAILYFTTPTCVPCKTTQRPAIQRLQERLGEGLQVIEIDATQRPDLADYWGVLSVPTTFIIDSHGQPRRVNHGVTGERQLLAQLREVESELGYELCGQGVSE